MTCGRLAHPEADAGSRDQVHPDVVATVLRLLAGGLSEREILDEYPDLQTEDIR